MADITKEMIDAALDATDFAKGPVSRRWMRKALAAAIGVSTIRGSWKDIGTAPKDNTPVWLGHICSYMEPAYFKRAGAGFWVNAYTGLPIAWRPSHWAPMPKPPVARSLIQQKEG